MENSTLLAKILVERLIHSRKESPFVIELDKIIDTQSPLTQSGLDNFAELIVSELSKVGSLESENERLSKEMEDLKLEMQMLLDIADTHTNN